MIKVCVVGALGKMGREVVKAVINAEDTELTAAVDICGNGQDIGSLVQGKNNNIYVEADYLNAIKTKKPDIVIDFTQPSAIFEHTSNYIKNKVKSVIGTTGLNDNQIKELKELSKENNTGCLIAPNFSTGAVLLMMFSKMAAKYFSNAEIIELHHNQKKDAPSGTAIKTAKMMAEINSDFMKGNCPETELIKGARGANTDSNIHIHSVRMPGYIASQEVILGSQGQILTMRHDTMERSCYMDGVLLALRYLNDNNTFIYGLDNIMK